MTYQINKTGAKLDQDLLEGLDCQPKETVVWDDLRFPAAGINPAGQVTPPTIDTADPFAGTLLFSASATNSIAGQCQLPHAWKEGSSLSPHVHWCPTSTDTGNVYWRLEYQVSDINGTFPGAYTTLNVLDAGDGITNKHQVIDFANIDMTGSTLSCMLLWKLSRIGGDVTDTYASTARFLEFDIHYQIDGNGSRQEYIK